MHTHLDAVFQALSDQSRRAILMQLADGEKTVSELAKPLSMTLAAASKHIRVLESAGFIRRDIRGRTHFCQFDPGPLASAQQWLSHYAQFWAASLDGLEKLVAQDLSQSAPEKEKS